MSTQKQFQSRSLETTDHKPLRRTQEFLKELKITMGLVRDLFLGVKAERIELTLYRAIVLVHLLKYFWYSIWH
jgi:hypothetical protein